jgi:hypothetical protein
MVNGSFNPATGEIIELPNGWNYTNPCGYSNYCNPPYYISRDFSSGGTFKIRVLETATSTHVIQINFTRPTSSYAYITGDDILCGGQSASYSLNNANGSNFNWSTSGGLNLLSSNGTNGSVGYSYDGGGTIMVNFNQEGCPVQSSLQVHTGIPSIFPSNWGSCYGYTLALNPQGSQWSNWFSDPSDWGTFYNYGTLVDAHAYYSGYTVVGGVFNECGQNGYTWVLDACSSYSYAVFPNPATEVINIEFKKADDKKHLPESIELINEDSKNDKIKLDIYEIFDANKIVGNKVNINVKNLKRGIYYLHAKFPDRKEDKAKGRVEKTRIVLQ